eukprot:361723-Chlamydomonas_euryale.AAC.4
MAGESLPVAHCCSSCTASRPVGAPHQRSALDSRGGRSRPCKTRALAPAHADRPCCLSTLKVTLCTRQPRSDQLCGVLML